MRPAPTATREPALEADQRLANSSRNQSLTAVAHAGDRRDSLMRLVDWVIHLHARNQTLVALCARRSDDTNGTSLSAKHCRARTCDREGWVFRELDPSMSTYW